MNSTIDLSSEADIRLLFPDAYLDEFTLNLGLDPAVSPEHQPTDIQALLHNAVHITEQAQFRVIIQKTVTLRGELWELDKFNDNRVYLPYGPVSALTTFTYQNLSAANIAFANYTLRSSYPAYVWAKNWSVLMTDPDTDVPEPIEISYTTGYSSFDEIPRSTLQAIKVLGYHLFMNNESEEIPNAYKDLAGQAKLMNIRCLDNV